MRFAVIPATRRYALPAPHTREVAGSNPAAPIAGERCKLPPRLEALASVVVLQDGRRREGHVVDRDLVPLSLRELSVAAVSHHVPGHRRGGAPRARAAVPQLAVEVEGHVPAVLGRDEVVPAVL